MLVALCWPLACGGKAVEDDGGGGTASGVGGMPAGTGNAPQLMECEVDSDCIVDSAHCCSCDPVSAEDLQAVRADWVDPEPECPCAPCQEVSELERTLQYFIAQCQAGQCTLVDIRDDYAECMNGEDCLLREGSDCCEGCDGQGYIAVSSLEFWGDRCDVVQCDACVSPVPAGLSAQCNLQTDRCEVVQQ